MYSITKELPPIGILDNQWIVGASLETSDSSAVRVWFPSKAEYKPKNSKNGAKQCSRRISGQTPKIGKKMLPWWQTMHRLLSFHGNGCYIGKGGTTLWHTPPPSCDVRRFMLEACSIRATSLKQKIAQVSTGSKKGNTKRLIRLEGWSHRGEYNMLLLFRRKIYKAVNMIFMKHAVYLPPVWEGFLIFVNPKRAMMSCT